MAKKKAKKAGKKRKPNAAFMKAMTPSGPLAAAQVASVSSTLVRRFSRSTRLPVALYSTRDMKVRISRIPRP